MKRIKLAVITTVSILTLIVILQNTKAVAIQLLFTTVTMPRAVLLLITLLVGLVLGLLTATVFLRRRG